MGSLWQISFTEYSCRPKILCLVYTLRIESVFVWLSCYFGLIFIKTYLLYAIALEDLLVIQQQKSFPNWHEVSFSLESIYLTLTLHRCLETLDNIYWLSPLLKLAKIYVICVLNFNVSLFGLLASCYLANLAWLFVWNSYRNLRITSTLLWSSVKFLTVQKKQAFSNEGLFHIIYVEESTNFLVNFED